MSTFGQNSSGRRLTIRGGPNDGEIVNWMGPVMQMPRPMPAVSMLQFDPDELPLSDSFPVDEYRAQQDDDGRWWYVYQ